MASRAATWRCLLAALALAARCRASGAAHAAHTEFFVDCNVGDDAADGIAAASAFRTVARSQMAVRSSAAHHRRNGGSVPPRVVHVTGLCELAAPLTLDSPDDDLTTYVGDGDGAVLSGGTVLDVVPGANRTTPVTVDLAPLNVSLGQLRGRGYSGGSACILLNNFEPSAAEVFYNPAGAVDYGPLDGMHLARFPNKDARAGPSTADWMQVTALRGDSIGLAKASQRLAAWQGELAAGGEAWTHGLWHWNWADSHRPVLAITPANGSVTVGEDDINRDVDLKTGGNLYAYNLKAELDAPGEYYIDRRRAELTLLPPPSTLPPPDPSACLWRVNVSRSDEGSGKVWESLIVHGARADTFTFKGCSATWGPMGRTCASKLHVPAGASLLINGEQAVVGEGTCCNGVRDAVLSATLLNCSQPAPPPAPPAPRGTYHLSRLPSVVVASGVRNVTLANLGIRHSRGGGVIATNCTGLLVDGCTVADHGMMGVNITNGTACGVQNSRIAGNGDVGVAMYGGSRDTLAPSGHFVHNCTLHHNNRWIMNYAPSVYMGGVGQSVTDSEIYAGPQIGVFLQGNDHTMSGCVLHDLVQQCSDCGAFYCGRDWTYRGNRLLNNHWSRLSSIFGNAHAVYLDDQLSSVSVVGNVFDHVGSVYLLGGGRNNEFVGNVLNGTGRVVLMDDRGGGGSKCCRSTVAPYEFLPRVPYQSAAYAKYANLSDLLADSPCTPKYNVISDNILCGGATSMGISPATVEGWGSTMANNSVGTC